jgi:hypothetical protein
MAPEWLYACVFVAVVDSDLPTIVRELLFARSSAIQKTTLPIWKQLGLPVVAADG